MAANIQLTTAYLNGVVLTIFLLGIYFVLFCGSIYVLWSKEHSGRINNILLSGIVVQFILITVASGIEWKALYLAFIQDGGTPGGSIRFYAEANAWWDVASSALGLVAVQVGNLIFINRVYTVWDRQFMPCVVPFVLMIGSIVSGVTLLVEMNKPATTTYASHLGDWIIAFLSTNLAQNTISTILIMGRIWRVYLPTPRFMAAAGVWSLIMIILDSGALYSLSVLVFVITYACQNNGAIIAAYIHFPILGIAFTLIVVRVGLGLAKIGPARHRDGVSGRETSAVEVFRLGASASKHRADTPPEKTGVPSCSSEEV